MISKHHLFSLQGVCFHGRGIIGSITFINSLRFTIFLIMPKFTHFKHLFSNFPRDLHLPLDLDLPLEDLFFISWEQPLINNTSLVTTFMDFLRISFVNKKSYTSTNFNNMDWVALQIVIAKLSKESDKEHKKEIHSYTSSSWYQPFSNDLPYF